MALVNGDVILVESDSNTYVGTTSTSLEVAADMIDKTTKDERHTLPLPGRHAGLVQQIFQGFSRAPRQF